VYDITQFKSVLTPSRHTSFDQQILNEPFGQHYSFTIPRRIEGFASDPLKSKLIFPPSVFDDPRSESSAAHLHSRLVCAFVNVPLEESQEYFQLESPYDPVMPNLRNGHEVRAELTTGSAAKEAVRNIMAQGTPTPAGLGISHYG
jgi:hypothetical protein